MQLMFAYFASTPGGRGRFRPQHFGALRQWSLHLCISAKYPRGACTLIHPFVKVVCFCFVLMPWEGSCLLKRYLRLQRLKFRSISTTKLQA